MQKKLHWQYYQSLKSSINLNRSSVIDLRLEKSLFINKKSLTVGNNFKSSLFSQSTDFGQLGLDTINFFRASEVGELFQQVRAGDRGPVQAKRTKTFLDGVNSSWYTIKPLVSKIQSKVLKFHWWKSPLQLNGLTVFFSAVSSSINVFN
jgi:hypothetical protein